MKKIKTSVIAISVLLLIFSTGCEKPGYQVKIIPGNNIYSLLLSSAPGLPLAPGVEKGEKPDDTHYEWSAGKGSFLEVGAGYKIIDLGSDIK